MQITFYELAARAPQRNNRGRRYYALYATRTLSVNTRNLSEALRWAQTQALDSESAIQVGEQVVLTAHGAENPQAVRVLRWHMEGKAGYLINSAYAGTLSLPMSDQSFIDANSVQWLAIAPGSVCLVKGCLYQWDGQFLSPVKN